MVPVKATADTSPRTHTISPNLHSQFTKSRANPFPANLTRIQIAKPPSKSLKISCSKEKDDRNFTDEILSMDLGIAVKKLTTDRIQREEALKKSRELLFAEICRFEGLESGDLRKKWRRLNEDEKWGLAKGFVAEWSAHFHPLSARSVKELVEEYVGGSDEFSDSVSGKLLNDIRNFFGFSGDSEE